MAKLKQFLTDESGATAIEYGLIAGGIAVAIIAAISAVGENLILPFEGAAEAMASAGF